MKKKYIDKKIKHENENKEKNKEKIIEKNEDIKTATKKKIRRKKIKK